MSGVGLRLTFLGTGAGFPTVPVMAHAAPT